jgi:hypothetical protein
MSAAEMRGRAHAADVHAASHPASHATTHPATAAHATMHPATATAAHAAATERR